MLICFLKILKKNCINKPSWVDSLYAEHEITKDYRDYVKTQIGGSLAWEVGNLCDRYLERGQSQAMLTRSAAIKQGIFEVVNPLNPKLRTCLSSYAYYFTYYSELYKTNKNVRKSQTIVSDEPFFALAPYDVQSYVWGRSIFYSKMYFPGRIDYCNTFQRYKAQYNNERIISYFENSDICTKVNVEENKILEVPDTDFFTFLQSNFPGKRLFIDLWATWCAPCKMEFKFYDNSFYDFMEKHKINLVYISTDKPEHRSKWEKEVKAIKLKGYHILAGNNLQSSIKEVIYDNNPMSIPRYILIDEHGKVCSADFKRPSDALFRSEIHKFTR